MPMDCLDCHETANFFYSVFYECRCSQIMKKGKGDRRKQTQITVYLLIYSNDCHFAADRNLGMNAFFSTLVNIEVMISLTDPTVTTRSATKSALKKLNICEDEMST